MLKRNTQENVFKQEKAAIVKKISNNELYIEYAESKDNSEEDVEEEFEDLKRRNQSCHHIQTDLYKTRIQMRELKFIPTEIFWIRLLLLLPLLPIMSLIMYPYHNLIYQFQIYWAATLLTFKCGVRWASIIIQDKNLYKRESYSWSCQNWNTLFSTLVPPLLAAVALQLSFPSNYILLTYAFMKTLRDEFSMQGTMPSGYIELEIITSVIAMMFTFFILCVNVFFDAI